MSKKCRNCQNRPIAGGTVRGVGDTDKGQARAVELCLPCLAEAGWENTHSDDGHGTDTEGSNDTAYCWICHPELNENSADYKVRAGTSRAGMVINVPIRASGPEKANAVAAKLPSEYATSVRTRKGITTLKAAKALGEGVVLHWGINGRFVSGTANGTKVRNVAEALRILAA